MENIYQYIEQYVQLERNVQWNVADYKKALEQLPSIINLLSNPFILNIAMDTLPSLMNRWKALHITRIALYDSFVDRWFKCAQDRLQ